MPTRTSPSTPRPQRAAQPEPRARIHLIPALLASGACAISSPLHALQLGELNVESALGQPLRASIAYALSPGEQLSDHCIFLRPAAGAGLPGISRALISVTGSRIDIRGTEPVKEPMVSLGVAVNCPYTANLTRSYTLMLDPVSIAETRYARNTEPRPAPAREPVVTTAAAPRPAASEPQRRAAQSRIGPSTTYRVRVGDSLSSIASRIDNRPVSLWATVDRLFAANPDAFIDNDINRLKAGSVLTIPSFDGLAAASVRAADAGPAAESDKAAAPAALVYEQPRLAASGATASPAEPAIRPPALEVDVSEAPAVAATAPVATVGDQSVDLHPGDVIVNADRPFVTPIGANEAPDAVAGTNLPDSIDTESSSRFRPAPTAANAVAATARTPAAPGGGLVYWIIGAGLVLGGAIAFLFGRRRSSGRSAPPVLPVHTDAVKEVEDDAPTAQNEALSEVDFDVSNLGAGTAVSLLDADLSEGTGLSEGDSDYMDMDDEFTTSGSLDIEFPDDAAITVESEAPPMIVTGEPAEELTILEMEVLPSDADDDEEDDYDVSMIMDATQHRFSDNDVAAEELEAIAVETDSNNAEDTSEYTLSNEMDYDILEQDYEDELTATQALNAEILKAAEELKSRLPGEDAATADAQATEDDDFALTSEQTALLHAGAKSDVVLEDTGINPVLADDDLSGKRTAIMSDADEGDDDRTLLLSEEDLLEELPGDRTSEIPIAVVETRKLDSASITTGLNKKLQSAENDETAELNLESGTYRTGS